MNNMKKKILVISIVVCILVMSAASATLSYFTDYDYKDNSFTIGNVDIQVNVDFNGAGTVYPTKVIAENATIKNVGTESAYVGAVITFTSNGDPIAVAQQWLSELMPDVTVNSLTVEGGVAKACIVYNEKLESGDVIDVFDMIQIPGDWGNDEMASLAGLNVKVEGYAIQTAGLETLGSLGALKLGFDAFDHIN